MTNAALTFRLDWGRGPFRVSAEREALRLQIVADPYDDDLRRVYADMAIEEGDPRGEYVRLGLLLDGEEDIARSRELERAMEDLRARYGRAIFAEWFGSILSKELPFLLRNIGTRTVAEQRAGFITSVDMKRRSPEQIGEALALAPLEGGTFPPELYGVRSIGETRDFRAPTAELFATFPVRPRSLSAAMIDNVSALLPLDRCGDLLALHLPLFEDDDEAIMALAKAAPRLRRVSYIRVSKKGARALSDLTDLRELEVMLTDDATFDPNAFPFLETLSVAGTYESLGSGVARRVRSLKLHSPPTPRFVRMLDGAAISSLNIRAIDRASLSVLAELSLPNLTQLLISALTFGDDSHAVASASFGAQLRSLALLDGRLSGAQLARLTESDLFANLNTLDLSGNPIGSTGANALATSQCVQALRSLKLRRARIGKRAIHTLMRELESLEVLHLHANGKNLRGAPVFAIAEMPHLRRVRDVGLNGQGNASSEDALIALAGSKNARALRRLAVGTISPDAMRALMTSPNLEELGEIGEFKPRGDTALYHHAQRRFGHRLIGTYALRRDLPEPDLDPWWTPL